MTNNGGGAATNAGSDYQQRVSAYFVLQMGLDMDCSSSLDKRNKEKILKVAFETDDSVDDIVLTHENSKSYLQAKRKLALSDKDGSEFCKTIDQFVKQSRASQNERDSYIIITSNETSKSISKHLRKITNSTRLSRNALEHNPLSKPEQAVYGKLKRCIQKSYEKNGFGSVTQNDIDRLVSKIHIVILDVERGGIHEKSFVESLTNKFNVESGLIWNMVIAQALDWSKSRQSVDCKGVSELLSKFKLKEFEQKASYLDNYFKVRFDADNDIICSGRELVLMKSPYPEHSFQLVELKRFDEQGNFRVEFNDNSIKLSNGSTFEIYGRFSTYKGAERFLEEKPEFADNLLLIPINCDDSGEYDNSAIAKAYSEKIRRHVLENQNATKCIHCENGLSFPAMLIEVQEEGIPFDAGNIHVECLRVSDRVLGKTGNGEVEQAPEFSNFDFNKWISLLDRSQGLWGGLRETVNQPVKNVFWNSNPLGDPNGAYCIKVKMKDETIQYCLERGKVQRYNLGVAQDICDRLENWRLDSIKGNNPLCLSTNGEVFGTQLEAHRLSSKLLDLVECESFSVAKFTRGIAMEYNKLNNFYAPLVAFTNIVTGEYITFNNLIFLITNPTELKHYIENWSKVDFTLGSYRLDIIETDPCFDKFMFWATDNNLKVVVDPFFDHKASLVRGSIVEDLEEIKTRSEANDLESVEKFSLLFTIDNDEGMYTHLFRDFVNDVTLLLNDRCTSQDCRCRGCQMYDEMILRDGRNNLDLRKSNDKTLVLNVSDLEVRWTQEEMDNLDLDWNYWEKIVFQ